MNKIASKKVKKIQKEYLSNVKSPVKRKLKYNNTTSKKRVDSFREKLDDAEKDKFRLSAKKGKILYVIILMMQKKMKSEITSKPWSPSKILYLSGGNKTKCNRVN